jgi:23S rRNA maturation-related 3'-5' exoribonuclease YhaM
MELLDRYEALKKKVTDRKEPFDRFIKLLEGETTWLVSPASTRFHLSEEQGLLKHSVGVTETLLRFREFLAPAIPEESCVIVGLFHDVGKLGVPGKPLYLQNDNEWMVKYRGYAIRSIRMW